MTLCSVDSAAREKLNEATVLSCFLMEQEMGSAEEHAEDLHLSLQCVELLGVESANRAQSRPS